ncbi:MAG: DUF2306 domain-containing protein [Acidobacteria bacterium]|nr:DUF2306 domain-containing protein [Acidobacteriota bacterium]
MIIFHGVLGSIALVTGALILLLKQGTPLHKRIGKVYVAAIYSLCFTSFFIFELFGRYGVFHIFSMVSIGAVTAGVIPLLRKKKDWYKRHFENMLWSYFGLVLATCSHFFGSVFVFFKSQEFSTLATWIFTAAIVWGIPHLVGVPLIVRKVGYFKPKVAKGTA